jgi:uncharacterized membrane protein YfcA
VTELFTVCIGAFIGFSAGMFGIGGALLATPLLRLLLGVPELYSVATPLPAAIPAAISGSFVYVREKMVRFDVAGRVLLTAVPISQVGVFLTGRTPGAVLMVLTGIVLVYSSWMFIQRGFRRPEPSNVTREVASAPAPQSPHWLMYVTGVVSGFVSGYLAIGGGIIMVPAFVKLLGMTTKQAVATSLFCVAALAIPGSIGHTIEGNILWDVALWLSLGVIPLGYVGATVGTKIRTRTLERAYGIVMLLFAV